MQQLSRLNTIKHHREPTFREGGSIIGWAFAIGGTLYALACSPADQLLGQGLACGGVIMVVATALGRRSIGAITLWIGLYLICRAVILSGVATDIPPSQFVAAFTVGAGLTWLGITLSRLSGYPWRNRGLLGSLVATLVLASMI